MSKLIKLLEKNDLGFRFERDVSFHDIYHNRVLFPTGLGFKILNIAIDEERLLGQFENQIDREINKIMMLIST